MSNIYEGMSANFFFNSEIIGRPVKWNWKEGYKHQAWNHKTGKPKREDLVILEDLAEEEKNNVKQELYLDILRDEHPNAVELKDD